MVTDWGGDYAELRWSAPKDEGCGTIERYVIEKRDIDMRIWMTAAQVPGTDTIGTVRSLREDSTYEFRVCAVNRKGQGFPSDSVLLERSKSNFYGILCMHTTRLITNSEIYVTSY